MNDITKICGAAILAAFCALSLKKMSSTASIPVTVATGIAILACTVPAYRVAISFLKSVCGEYGGKYTSIMLKSLGVGTIAQCAADTCRDAGEGSLASKVELCAKLEIAVLGLPVIADVLGAATSLVGK